VRSPRFVAGGSLAVLAAAVAVLVAVSGSDWGLSETALARGLAGAVVALVVGVLFALSGYRLTARQQQYLDRAEREHGEVLDYLEFLDGLGAGVAAGPDSAPTDGPADDASGDDATDATVAPRRWWELRTRLERAEENLRKARRAVYRRDYPTFLSLFYEASRQEILLYDVLDERAGGWTFGLGIDPERGSDAPGPHRRRNLSRRIRSAAGSLPEAQSNEVAAHLDGTDGEQTPLDLYYAVRVLHGWNVGQFERATQVRRFLRGGIGVLTVVLVSLAAVLVAGFDGLLAGANAMAGDAAVDSGSVLVNDWFLGLIVLAGALGAVFSMVFRSFGEFYTLTTDPSVPQPVFMLEALLARTLIGSVSALFLFLVARTEFAGVVFAQGLLGSPLALLVVGFVGGFSEQLVDEAVEKVVEEVDAPEEAEGGEGDRTAGQAGADSGAQGDADTDEADETGEETVDADDADTDEDGEGSVDAEDGDDGTDRADEREGTGG
jgi:hypothetical protein